MLERERERERKLGGRGDARLKRKEGEQERGNERERVEERKQNWLCSIYQKREHNQSYNYVPLKVATSLTWAGRTGPWFQCWVNDDGFILDQRKMDVACCPFSHHLLVLVGHVSYSSSFSPSSIVVTERKKESCPVNAISCDGDSSLLLFASSCHLVSFPRKGSGEGVSRPKILEKRNGGRAWTARVGWKRTHWLLAADEHFQWSRTFLVKTSDRRARKEEVATSFSRNTNRTGRNEWRMMKWTVHCGRKERKKGEKEEENRDGIVSAEKEGGEEQDFTFTIFTDFIFHL